jgi:nucleotide-binding universal stress UspA family protein
MLRFKNILVVVDAQNISSQNEAIRRGTELARENDATLTLLHVFDEPKSSIERYQDFISAEELSSVIRQRKMLALEEIVEPIKTMGFTVGARVVAGRGFIEIITQVLKHNYDIVIKVVELHGSLLNSNDVHLMRKCPCPVWLIRHEGASKTILAAIDLSLEDSAQGKALNKLIMDLATSVAARDQSQLYLLSCWTLYGESTLRSSGLLKVSQDRIDDMLVGEHRENLLRQRALGQSYSLDDEQLVLVKGSPDDIIPQFMGEKQINTVVMGTIGRTGVPGLIIGNTAETVLHSIDSSVIAVKPDSFVSPVKM